MLKYDKDDDNYASSDYSFITSDEILSDNAKTIQSIDSQRIGLMIQKTRQRLELNIDK